MASSIADSTVQKMIYAFAQPYADSAAVQLLLKEIGRTKPCNTDGIGFVISNARNGFTSSDAYRDTLHGKALIGFQRASLLSALDILYKTDDAYKEFQISGPTTKVNTGDLLEHPTENSAYCSGFLDPARGYTLLNDMPLLRGIESQAYAQFYTDNPSELYAWWYLRSNIQDYGRTLAIKLSHHPDRQEPHTQRALNMLSEVKATLNNKELWQFMPFFHAVYRLSGKNIGEAAQATIIACIQRGNFKRDVKGPPVCMGTRFVSDIIAGNIGIGFVGVHQRVQPLSNKYDSTHFNLAIECASASKEPICHAQKLKTLLAEKNAKANQSGCPLHSLNMF